MNSRRDITWLGFASDEFLPSLSTLANDIGSVLLVLALAGECKLVLWLSVWDFVDSEPLICGPQETWEVSLNILNIVELWCQWVVNINDNDLPVSLLLIEKSHNTKDLDLLDLSWVANKLTNFANIQWVVVSLGLGLRVDDVGVFPCLQHYLPVFIMLGLANIPEGKHRSSRGNPCGGSSFGRSEACLS
jgi:hypothetical protein